jgi:hypothetical protein
MYLFKTAFLALILMRPYSTYIYQNPQQNMRPFPEFELEEY